MISSRLSIRDSKFHIVSQDKIETLDETSLDVIIVGANPALAKQYYEGESYESPQRCNKVKLVE